MFGWKYCRKPHENIFLEQSSPPHTPAPESPPSPSTRQADRSPRLRATAKSRDFRRPTLSPKDFPPPSNIYPRRATLSRAFSMSTQVLAGHNLPNQSV
ncbi:hypothetical protein PILCRDRAFT_210550 [Piloderma croceum F 1598]|uniref:Uncharacterized protein n=1 Tax=Piloderma croceum (strain F 1598) TaxID=765440 RepID=A0A0C3GBH0_PILCF|nr:hypothetical protein PILCRDRAFT_210550 [Piloderma croceum F 1598]